MGLKRETWCHFGKAWCHFVWFDWLACLPFCFVFLFGCFIGVCVRECLLLYLLLFLRTVFSLYQSVTLLDLQRCIFEILHLWFNPQLSSFPPPLRPPIRQRAVFAKAVIHASKRVKPTTTDRRNSLHQLPALKAPYLLPTLQEIEASDTSQMIKSIGSCTGPCKWLDFRCSIDSIQLYWIHP